MKLSLLYAIGCYDKTASDAMLQNKHTSADIKKSHYYSYLSVDNLPKEYIPQGFVPTEDGYGDDKIWNSLKDVFLNPYFGPLLASDLSGLPSTYLLTVEEDMLRDDGILYAKRLSEAGNDVSHVHYKNAIHDMINDFQVLCDARVMFTNLLDFIEQRV